MTDESTVHITFSNNFRAIILLYDSIYPFKEIKKNYQ